LPEPFYTDFIEKVKRYLASDYVIRRIVQDTANLPKRD
jgi:hypothetical protein